MTNGSHQVPRARLRSESSVSEDLLDRDRPACPSAESRTASYLTLGDSLALPQEAMSLRLRRLARLSVAGLCCLFALSAARADATSNSAYAPGGAPESALNGPLGIAGAPTEPEQLAADAIAQLSNPQAIAEREASRTKYENLTTEQARAVADEDFPAVIAEPLGGPPKLPASQRITGYVNANTAQVDLGGGEAGLVQSLAPMAIKTSSAGWTPVDLGVSEVAGSFEPETPLVSVRIPKRLAEGAQLPAADISLTPVDEQGAPLGGSEGAAEGAVVFFANSGLDSDTIVKPTSFGAAVDTLLRSTQSPQALHFRVGMPEGARLLANTNGSGAEVVKEGATIAAIPAPAAQDAAGIPVPVSMNVAGDTLTLTVSHRAGSYLYPVEVDPEFNTITDSTLSIRPWIYNSPTGGFVQSGVGFEHSGGYAYGQRAEVYYKTNGDSKIYALNTAVETPTYGAGGKMYIEADASIYTEFEGPGGYENSASIAQWPNPAEPPPETARQVCVAPECSPANGGEHNLVRVVGLLEGSLNAELFYVRLRSATVSISQPKETHATVHYDAENAEVDHTVNVFHNGWFWMGPNSGAFEYTANDLGLGVAGTKVEYHAPYGWQTLHSRNYLSESSCVSIQCSASQSEAYTYNSLGYSLPNGTDKIRVTADDAVPGTWSSEHGEGETELRIDTSAPYGLTLTGLASKGEELELGEAPEQVKVEATDGEGSVHSSGIKAITLGVDGKEVGKPSGACFEGPCTVHGEWTLNGAELGTGTHTLTALATDNAGNITTKSYTLRVYQASPVAIGPGSVNPESGDFALEAADVGFSGGTGTLAVTRHYDSRNLTEGDEGPLGPQWTLSLGSLDSLEVLPDNSVMVVGPEGLTHFALKKGGGFEAPPGDANLTLELKGSEYLLNDPAKDTTTRFTQPAGAKSWMPTVSEGPVATNTMTDEYRSVEVSPGNVIVEPTLELAPHPTATCAREKLERGCRALEFVYASETKASGEAQGEWGDYKNRLKEVLAVAWDPATKAVTKTAEAAYEYDKQGRMRAEWDPQIAPTLKTTYGYDSEGHVTALTPAGKQPWIFTYGTTATDPNPGRLLSATRPNASTPSGNGKTPENTVAPTLSRAKPIEGVPVTVSTGTWTNAPDSYSYQWLACEGYPGEEHCEPLPGATNRTYTPIRTREVAYVLRAEVFATNGDGTVSAETARSEWVEPSSAFESKRTFGKEGSGNGELRKPTSIAYDETEKVLWVADTGNNRIEKFSPSGEFLAACGKAGSGTKVEFNEPVSIAVSPAFSSAASELLVADAGNKRIQVISKNCEFLAQTTTEVAPTSVAAGHTTGCFNPCDVLYTTELGKPRIASRALYYESKSFGFSEPKYTGALGSPSSVAVQNKVYVTEPGLKRVQIYTAPTEWSQALISYAVFGTSGTGNGQFKNPSSVTFATTHTLYPGNYGLVLVADPLDNRVQQFSQSQAGTYEQQYDEEGTGQEAGQFSIATNYGGTVENLYVLSKLSSSVREWTPAKVPPPPPPAPPAREGASQWTVEYHVPVSGSGAPHPMSSVETAKWGQSDNPAEATAIFPPDEPMGWPAADYKRATVYYLDSQARTVNIAAPSGGISTKEYNEYNQLTRSLSADDRALALAEGCVSEKECRSAEVAKRLDTKNTYGGEGQLTDARGPQHLVKLAKGKGGKPEEALARNHVKYFYNEGAPAGETYDLVTKTIDGAETESLEEFDKRTATTSYSGQANLGWKLRSPTSVTTDPGGLNLTRTTVYDEKGNVIETRAPASKGANDPHDGKTIYYTAKSEAEVATCREHPEWVGLPCQTKPGAQPTSPELPVTTFKYNVRNQPETVTEAFGSTTRTKKTGYDGAGRPVTTEETSSIDTPLPKVSEHYNTTSGALETQSTSVGESTQTTTRLFNTVGELIEYTDADGNTAKYTYDEDGRPTEISDGSAEHNGKQKYSYDPTTGFLSELIDSAAGTFKAGYDVSGAMTSETYPNSMTATYTRDPAGEASGIEYTKTKACAKSCPEQWFADSTIPSIHGETMRQTSSLAEEPSFNYDPAGRLLEVQEVPAGEGCSTRVYAYNEEGDRTSLTTRKPGSEGKCAAEGGTVEKHSYDEANRLTDPGVAYEAFGNTTTLPAADADGSELKSFYYVDNQVAKQVQNGETIEYKLDPESRTRETISSGNTAATVISHYDAPGDAVAWTSEEGGAKRTRNVPGMDGALTATQASTGAITLLLHDLRGNVVATVGDSEAETKLLSKYNSTEFGVPTTKEAPPKYAWLGAAGVAGELPSGVITRDGITYVPLTGQALQTQGTAPPTPTNAATPFTKAVEEWVGSKAGEGAARELAKAQEEEAAREAANRPAGAIPCSGAYALCEGEGPGEETFGDPVHCYVDGTTVVDGNRAAVFGDGGCSEGLPEGTWLYVCIGSATDAGPKTAGGCNHITVEHHRSRHWAIGLSRGLHCESNEIVRALVEFYVPGGKVLYAGTENGGECEGGTDGIDESALTLFGSPDTGGALELLLSFFRGE